MLTDVAPYEYDAAFVKLIQDQESGSVVLQPYQITETTGVVRNSGDNRGRDTVVYVIVFSQLRQTIAFVRGLTDFIKALWVRLPARCRTRARISTYDASNGDDEVLDVDVRNEEDLKRFLRALFSRPVPVRQVPSQDVPDPVRDRATAAVEPKLAEDEQTFQNVRRFLHDKNFSRPISISGVKFTLRDRWNDVSFYSMHNRERTDSYFTLDLDFGEDAIWTMRVEEKITRVGRASYNQVNTETSGPTAGTTLSAWIENALVMLKGLAEKLTDEFSSRHRGSDRVFFRNYRTGPGRDDYVGVFRVRSAPDVFKFEILDDRHKNVLGVVSFPRAKAIQLVLSTGNTHEVWSDTAFNIWKEKHHAG